MRARVPLSSAMSDESVPDETGERGYSLSSAKPDERAPNDGNSATSDGRAPDETEARDYSLSSAMSDERVPTKHGRAPYETGRETALSSATSDERAPAERLLPKLSDVRQKSASQTGRREAALQARRRPMERVPDEPGLLYKLSDVQRKSTRLLSKLSDVRQKSAS